MNWALVTLLAVGATLQGQQKFEVYRFEVDVRNVYVDVFVTDNGKSVTGLTAEDFAVWDDGVLQTVDLVDIETIPMSVMLVLDTSASVFGEKLSHLREAAHAFIDRLRDVDEAGLLTFSYEWQLLKRPTQDFDSLHRALNRRITGGPTGLYDALYAGMKLVETRPGRPLVLLFTDGADNASWLSAEELRDVARSTEAMVHVVAIQSKAGVYVDSAYDPTSMDYMAGLRISGERGSTGQFVNDIAEVTGGRVWIAKTSADLTEVYMRVIEDIESRYLLSYTPKGVPKEGWHPLEVKLKNGKKGTIRARPGYLASTPPNQ